MGTDSLAERPTSRFLILLGAAFALLVLAPSGFGRYGLFIDELYYVACSKRLAFGYVDHPPLSIWLLRASRMLLGDGQVALRVLPALAGGLTVVTAGLLARRFGAGAFGQILAGLAVATAPIPTLVFGFYSMNAFEILLWTFAAYAAAKALSAGKERWWLAFGAAAGLAMMNKHTFVLLGAGIVAGLALTPARRALASRWFWCGIAIAAVIFLPNVLWEVAKGWPTLEFYRNADLEKNVSTPPLEALMQQILFMNPASAILWSAGIVFLLLRAEGRRWKSLGWTFAILLALIVFGGKSRPDRIAGAYPIAFAAGAVLWERVSEGARWRWLRWTFPALLVLPAVALAPLSFPILSPESLARYAERTGVVPQVEAGEGKEGRLPQWMADRLEWREFVEQIAAIVDAQLTPDERAHAVILVPSYGHAGALEYYGRGRGLPPVVGTQNSCADWAPTDLRVDVVVAVEYGRASLGDAFEEIRQVDVTHTTFGTPWRDGLPISIARKPKRSFWEISRRLRHYV